MSKKRSQQSQQQRACQSSIDTPPGCQDLALVSSAFTNPIHSSDSSPEFSITDIAIDVNLCPGPFRPHQSNDTTTTRPLPLTPSIKTPLTVLTALYLNGLLQSLPCAASYSSRTPLPTPSLPFPLHPTQTQLMIVHPRWIDRLPFPRMRDSLIQLIGVLDEEEIIMDIFTMPSWRIVEGGQSWDPGAWRMEKEWAEKWGWLMV